MKLRTKGKAINIRGTIVTKVTRYPIKAFEYNYALLSQDKIPLESDILYLSTINTIADDFKGICVYRIQSLDHLMEGDIVAIGENGNIRTVYRVNSNHNSLLVTERCNSNCLMCSQPPKDRDDVEYLHNIHKQLIPLIPKDCVELGITGGEPTVLGQNLFELLDLIKSELPTTEIHMLTNGRSFAINALAEKLGNINNPRLMLGIPVYSDYYQIHDYVVQAKNAFYQTMMGIYNLKRYGIRVEIRVVLHKITIPRLVKLAKYIYKNLAFVDHVAFMGLEITGFTLANLEDLWIEPKDYIPELQEAVEYLGNRGMHVSIYNTPLCILPKEVWQYARKSISDWKNIYFDECSKCAMLDKCGGLFASATKRHSKYIKAFNEIVDAVFCEVS